MYDMYPDWGPAKNDPEHPLHRAHGGNPLNDAFNRTATALRDDDGPLPDDN